MIFFDLNLENTSKHDDLFNNKIPISQDSDGYISLK
jgi:hypothetical protein